MPRTNQHGKPIRRVLGWLLNIDLSDAQMAAALGMPGATYSRRKVEDDFPTFEELTSFGEHFGINPLVLQISFGFISREAIYMLDDAGMDQYLQQGGGDVPHPSPPWGAGRNGEKTQAQPIRK
jgi:hypothetical protein